MSEDWAKLWQSFVQTIIRLLYAAIRMLYIIGIVAIDSVILVVGKFIDGWVQRSFSNSDNAYLQAARRIDSIFFVTLFAAFVAWHLLEFFREVPAPPATPPTGPSGGKAKAAGANE